MLPYPTEVSLTLLASLLKFHFHPAVLGGFRRLGVSPCRSPCKLSIWPWRGTGRAHLAVLTAQLWVFSETLASVASSGSSVPHLLID